MRLPRDLRSGRRQHTIDIALKLGIMGRHRLSGLSGGKVNNSLLGLALTTPVWRVARRSGWRCGDTRWRG